MANFDLFDADAQMKNRSAASARKNNRGGLDNPDPINVKHHQEDAEIEMMEKAYQDMNNSNEQEEILPQKSSIQEEAQKAEAPENSKERKLINEENFERFEEPESGPKEDPSEEPAKEEEKEVPAEEPKKEESSEIQAQPEANPKKSEDEIISDIIHSFQALIPCEEEQNLPKEEPPKEEEKSEPSVSKQEPEVPASVKRFKRLTTKKEEPKIIIALSEGTQTLVFSVGEYQISTKIEIIKK